MDYTLDQFIEYQSSLNDVIKNPSSKIFYNDSFVHATMVFKAIIDKSVKDKKPLINLYCGKFSIFRDGAKAKIEKIIASIKPDDNDKDTLDTWNKFKPFSELRESLKTFFNSGGYFNLIVEREAESLETDSIWNIIADPIQKGLMKVYQLSTPIGIDHFATSGNMYRRENSDEKKTALCCFDDNETVQILNTNFDLLKSKSQKISFN